jgi:H+/Cl- antiporter ClcA
MVLELTRTLSLSAPMLLAVVGATVVSRRLDLRSIYSARLSPDQSAEVDPGTAQG